MLIYHIFRVVLCSKCVEELVWLGWDGLELYPCCRLKHNFILQVKVSQFKAKYVAIILFLLYSRLDGNIY